MAQITSRAELEEWLKKQGRADWAQVIAARAALRTLPYAFIESTPRKWIDAHALSLFRAAIISWAACNFPAYDMIAAAAGAANATDLAYTSTDPADVTADAAADVVDAFDAANRVFDIATILRAADAADAAADAAIRANDVATAVTAVWANINRDCNWLAAKSDNASASRRLTHERLWSVSSVPGWHAALQYAIDRLFKLDQDFGLLIDWYNRRLEGSASAFAIDGGASLINNQIVLARLADATDEDFWGKGATYVNTTLQGWIDEARAQAASEDPEEPPPPTPEAIRAVAAEIASPNVALTNNKLDVTANTAFDGQTDVANLDEAIAVLRAVVRALLDSIAKDLPGNGNIPYSFAANLTIYDGELAKRDAKPFLGVLVRMEKSVSAGFHADPEMFDAGVTTNFESYFEAHLAFMTHYRRNEERETKIAQFKIDDAAASGAALTGPVDDVVKEVGALAEQGLVTDGFVQEMKERKAINDEVALYTSSAPTVSGEPTVKERHILQTVGFYERALAVVNNVVSITTQFAPFITAVEKAIDKLVKLFGSSG